MKRNSALMTLMVVCLAGCVTGAVNPYYTPEAVVPSAEFDGKWNGVEIDQEGKERRTPIEISDGKILILEDGDEPEEGAITFFKVDGQLFADMQAKAEDQKEISPHLLFKILQAPGELGFVPLDYVWLESEIDAGSIDLPIEKDEENRSTLFTASSAQWLEFISKRRENEYAFPLKEEFKLRRNQ